MILVTGSLLAQEQHVEALLALSLEHVRRSRAEPGCLSHAVHRDVENPLKLVFIEEWADLDALKAHFAVPASRAFVKAAAGLVAARPTLQLFDATAVEL